MITHPTQFKRFWQKWVRKRNQSGNPQSVHSRNLYVLPSGFGWVYGVVVLAIFLGAINSQISTVFYMAFLLAVIGIVSAWEAHANLKNLSFRLINVEDSSQGTPARMTIIIQPNNKLRWGIEFQIAAQPKTRLERIPPEGLQFVIPVETTERGYFLVPVIVISSLYPFGIFRVWSYAYFDDHYYVYPQPVDPGFWPDAYIAQNEKQRHALGDDNVYDLKQVENPWAAPKLIHWKIAAKGQGWYLKIMDSNEVDNWLFKLNDLSFSKDLEVKLQNLSYWLQTAESSNQIYALELKDTRTAFSNGKEHLQSCLRQLALYQ